MMNRIEDLLLKALRHWLPYYIVAWLAAATTSAVALEYAWVSFVSTDRRDGASGHATIDFGGQYLMGRMLVTGHGQELYNRHVQRQVLREAYPDNDSQHPDENEPAHKTDTENLMYWMMGDQNDAPARVTLGSLVTPLAAADPWQAAAYVLANEDPWAWYRLTDLSLASLRAAGVDERVLAKLDTLRGKRFDSPGNLREALDRVLDRKKLEELDQDDAEHFPELVWAHLERDSDSRMHNAVHPVGGPLYPPVNAIFYSPLALMDPHLSYRVQQIFNVLLVFVAAAGARTLARGRVWIPVMAVFIMLFPGFAGSVNLGQNATLTLVILVWGWALAARGRPALGGMVWGLLAFKPVWALSFLLVPLLTRRWRFGLTMIATGTGLALMTLPFVGLHSWFDWLAVGKEATDTYDRERNWIFLSRDLLSVPRRYLLDFDKGYWERLDQPFWLLGRWEINVSFLCTLLGGAMVVFALENTVRLAVLRRRQAPAADGPPAAFLLLGAWMCCYHFMYYDALLGSLGLFLLFTEPRRYLSPLLVALAPLQRAVAGRAVVAYHQAAPPEALPPPVVMTLAPRSVWTLNRMAPTAVLLLLLIHYLFPVLGWGSHWGAPWDTFALAGVWAWCGWQWLRRGEKVATSWAEPEPPVFPFDVEPVGEVQRNGETDGSADDAIRAPLPGGYSP